MHYIGLPRIAEARVVYRHRAFGNKGEHSHLRLSEKLLYLRSGSDAAKLESRLTKKHCINHYLITVQTVVTQLIHHVFTVIFKLRSRFVFLHVQQHGRTSPVTERSD